MIERVEADARPLLLAMGLGGLLALSAALLSFPYSGLVFVVGGVVVLSIFNRRAALFLILPAIALSSEMPVAGVPIRVDDLLMVPLVAGWLAHLCIFKNRQRTPLDRLLVAYFIIGLLASLWGGHLGTAHFTAITKDYSASFHLLKRLEFVFLYLIVCDALGSPRDVRWLTYMLMASMLGLSAVALASFLSNHAIAIGPADPGHEPGLASMLNVALALSLFPSAKRLAKLLLSAVLLFSLAVLPLTLGRNYLVSTGIVIVYAGLFRQRWLLAFLPILGLVGSYLFPASVVHQVQTLEHTFAPDITGEHSEGASLLSRTIAPGTFGLVALGHSPVLGFGLASVPLGRFDSEYVTQLLYTGLVGLAAFFVLATRVWRLTGEAVRAAHDPVDAGLARGFQLIWVAYAAHSIFSPSISANRAGAVFFVAAGLLAVLRRSLTESTTEMRRVSPGSPDRGPT